MARFDTPTRTTERDSLPTSDTYPRPPLLESILPQLIAPFFSNQVYIKPGALTRERNRALALIYLDRRAIAQRLDDLAGARNWIAVPEPWGDNGVIMALTILGVTKYGDGEAEPGEPNCKTSASAQAFKRAFTEFGCRYTYTHFPKAWFDYDERSKGFVNPYDAILRLYQAAGLEDFIVEETVTLARETARKHAARMDSSRAEERALAEPSHLAHSLTAPVPSASAPEATIRMITTRQLAVLQERKQLDLARTQFGVARLEDLTFVQASMLIRNLPPRARISYVQH